MALELLAQLSRALGRALPPTLAWDFPSIDALARHLAHGDTDPASPDATDAIDAASIEPIAVIGLACRLPGAQDADAFWRLLCSQGDAIREVPKERWDAAAYYDPDRNAPGKMNTRWGGFLDAIDQFDPAPFGISPREAAQIDPQQRLMLELAWEALEDAGIPSDRLRDSRTGVFCGAMTQDYARLIKDGADHINEYSATGQDTSIIAARISYTFGLQGPSLVVNTACSSSLVAVHLACQSLQSGESTLALAGGVNALLAPESTVAMTKFGGMSPEGRSRAFDAKANGYVRAEGGGIVVLKRLSRALADGDPIWCVIRGSAINNDGFSNGLTAPNPKAQMALLQDAYRRAGIPADAVQYVEAHGTGTALGDPIEVKSLGAVLGAGRSPEHPLAVGSVKTNIGHLEAAAGIAGLIKVALCVRHQELPGNLHFERPNPHIPFADLRIRVQDALSPWPRPDAPMIAGVSSFGFGGTNCHVVVSEPPARPVHLLPLSVPTEAEIHERAGTPPRLVFVFSGNGSQWRGMGRQLLHASPLFRARIAACGRAMQGLLGRSLLDELCAEPARAQAQELPVHLDQAMLFAVQIGLAALWRSWGIEPDAVVGHSVGEVAAACVAGILDLEQAAQVVVHRGRLQEAFAGQGSMALVACPPGDLEELVARSRPDLAIAAVNAPSATVLSGSLPALNAAINALERRGVVCRRMRVNVAYHSPQMDPLREALPRLLTGISPRAAQVRMMSTVTGDWLDGAGADADYWGRNLRQPVLFAQAIDHLLRDGHRLFLEISPHPILVESMRACADGVTPEAEILGSLHREDDAQKALLASLAALHRRGRSLPSPPPATTDPTTASGDVSLLPLSAHSPGALTALAGQVARWLDGQTESSVRDLCFTASTRRAHRAHRLAVVASSRQEMVSCLQGFARGEVAPGVIHGREGAAARRGPVFVFPGQGCQWAGMGRRLLASEPVFRDALHACDRAMRAHVSWSVVELLASGRPLQGIDVIQPALFAVQVALAALWRSLGIVPEAVIGQSMGEVAAACVAGALDIDAAAQVICRRSLLLRRISGRGAMALVALSLPDAELALRGRERALSVAVASSPASTVIAGDPTALHEVLAQLKERNVYCQPVHVDVASHSPQVDELLDDLRAELRELRPRPAEVPMFSTLSGELLAGAACDAAYWVRNLREPVRFASAVQRLIADGHEVFLEISPHPVVLHSVEEGLRHAGRAGLTLPSLRRDLDERTEMRRSLGTLYAHGSPVAWSQLYPDGGHHVRLPPYPWARRSFWLDTSPRRKDAPDGWFYEITWRPPDAGITTAAGSALAAAGTWILCADRGGTAAALASAIAARGGRPVLVPALTGRGAEPGHGAAPQPRPEGDLADAIRAAGDLRAVIHLGALDLPAPGDHEPSALLESAVATVTGVARWVGDLLRETSTRPRAPRLWMVTRGVQPAAAKTVTPHGLSQAPLWGLGRVVALEHPELWGGLVDLDPSLAAAEQAMQLLDAMLEAQDEDQTALRGGARLVPRLTPLRLEGPPRSPVAFRSDSTYLITGGLGAIGTALARWLTDRGVRHLLLLGRSSQDQGAERLSALAAPGVEVRYLRADVADAARMAAVLASIERSMPPLRGVFHAAGALSHERLVALDSALARAVLAPKVAGGWILHQLTERLPLDLFVLFSSASSVWGASGQAHYAAANHALDTLAHYRRGLGLPALSVNWGLWAGEGLGAKEADRSFADVGLAAMAPQRAFACIERLLAAGITQATVADVDWQKFKPTYEARRRRPFVSTIHTGHAGIHAGHAGIHAGHAGIHAGHAGLAGHSGHASEAPASAEVRPSATEIMRTLQAAPASQRLDLLREHVRELVASVLGLGESHAILPHDGFFRIGMNSVMAVELASRLQNSLGRSMPSTVTFDYPSVEALSGYLATIVLDVAGPAAQPPAPASPLFHANVTQPIAMTDAPPDDLSESDLLSLLSERLPNFS